MDTDIVNSVYSFLVAKGHVNAAKALLKDVKLDPKISCESLEDVFKKAGVK